MTLHNLSSSLLIGCVLVPQQRMTSGPLPGHVGQSLIGCCSLPGAFQAVTSHQCPRATVPGQALSPCLLKRGKRCFCLEAEPNLLFKSMRLFDNHAFFLPKYPVVKKMRRFCTQDGSTSSTRKYTKLETKTNKLNEVTSNTSE